ncbi:YHYH protein [Cochlodiniinecator piscidefendens]|uniref:YHYH protein n=1 Tax=Cochlodiniinecator piscidefendens TaxID=2715756 RepID=UPI00140C0DB2|nr:YHYH protein [Cochlodiniinecator piscidefendens]
MDKQLLKGVSLAVLIAIGFVAESTAQGRPKMREHTTTAAQELMLNAAQYTMSNAQVSIEQSGTTRRLSGNGLPTHAVGAFPNAGNPHEIQMQDVNLQMPVDPETRRMDDLGLGDLFGVAVNGVVFDPGAAEFWQGNPNLGWQYEALGGAVTLGLDTNYAHVQPDGTYHYHGLPVGLMQELGWSATEQSPLIGWAADGFPIYALTAEVDGAVVMMESAYQLRSGDRPGGQAPTGAYDGAFVQDYLYVAGSGTLDECNGAVVRTADYPDGTYAYFLTVDYPIIPRCLMGNVDPSFIKR